MLDLLGKLCERNNEMLRKYFQSYIYIFYI